MNRNSLQNRSFRIILILHYFRWDLLISLLHLDFGAFKSTWTFLFPFCIIYFFPLSRCFASCSSFLTFFWCFRLWFLSFLCAGHNVHGKSVTTSSLPWLLLYWTPYSFRTLPLTLFRCLFCYFILLPLLFISLSPLSFYLENGATWLKFDFILFFRSWSPSFSHPLFFGLAPWALPEEGLSKSRLSQLESCRRNWSKKLVR
jgi:hypothetical protein